MPHFRTEPTTVEKALAEVRGFQKVFSILEQQTAIRGQSKSTLNNYMRRIATICLHFGRLPELISDDEINEYLAGLALSCKFPLWSI